MRLLIADGLREWVSKFLTLLIPSQGQKHGPFRVAFKLFVYNIIRLRHSSLPHLQNIWPTELALRRSFYLFICQTYNLFSGVLSNAGRKFWNGPSEGKSCAYCTLN